MTFHGRGHARLTREGEALRRRLGRLAFSQAQEREADHLSAMMLHRAGHDQGRARGLMLTLARISGQTSSGWLDARPAGIGRGA